MKNIILIVGIIIAIALIIPVSADDCVRYSHNQVCPATELANSQATHYHAGDLVSTNDHKIVRYVEGYNPITDVYGSGIVTKVLNDPSAIQISHRVSTENRVDFEKDFPVYVSSFPAWFVAPIPVEKWLSPGIRAGDNEY